ncbi:MAG: c-type cytochrome [Betaproteobacteria bacterium]|nr:c-type cytochrome [Betaproteobacteria bacterium]
MRLRHLAALALFAPAWAQGLTPVQERGREIYLTGQSAAGREIGAVISAGSDPVPATLLPCAKCHGDDGRGRPEGGVRPADITPAALGRDAWVGARSRPAYTRPLLERAFRMGYDAGRNELDRTMPRFRMTPDDANDLLAYLEILGSDAPRGVSDDAVRINVVGAPGLVATTASIYGRRIELRHGRGADALLTIDATPDGDATLDAAGRDSIPALAVHSARAVPGRYAFVMTATNEDQVAALLSYARGKAYKPVMLTSGCRGIGNISRDALVLMTSQAAANCDPASIPRSLDRRVIVAAPSPPGPEGASTAAQAALSIVANVLAQLGRDLSSHSLLAVLERVHRFQTPGFAPVTWTANRHFGTKSVWLMTLDLQTQRLIGEPGWVEGE